VLFVFRSLRTTWRFWKLDWLELHESWIEHIRRLSESSGNRSVLKRTIVYRRVVREPQSYSTFGHLCTCWLEWEHKPVRIVTFNMRKSVVFRLWIAPVPLVVTVNCLSAWLLMFTRRVMFLKRIIWATFRPSTNSSSDVFHPHRFRARRLWKVLLTFV